MFTRHDKVGARCPSSHNGNHWDNVAGPPSRLQDKQEGLKMEQLASSVPAKQSQSQTREEILTRLRQ